MLLYSNLLTPDRYEIYFLPFSLSLSFSISLSFSFSHPLPFLSSLLPSLCHYPFLSPSPIFPSLLSLSVCLSVCLSLPLLSFLLSYLCLSVSPSLSYLPLPPIFSSVLSVSLSPISLSFFLSPIFPSLLSFLLSYLSLSLSLMSLSVSYLSLCLCLSPISLSPPPGQRWPSSWLVSGGLWRTSSRPPTPPGPAFSRYPNTPRMPWGGAHLLGCGTCRRLVPKQLTGSPCPSL